MRVRGVSDPTRTGTSGRSRPPTATSASTLGLQRVYATVDGDNVGSIALLERLGYERLSEVDGAGTTVCILARDADRPAGRDEYVRPS